MVIVVRTDIGMGPGKIASQAAHASTAWLVKRLRYNSYEGTVNISGVLPSDWPNYIDAATRKKVVVGVDSELELLALAWKAKEAGLEVNVIEDEGLTVFDGQITTTCMAIGPNLEDQIDAITGHLELLP